GRGSRGIRPRGPAERGAIDLDGLIAAGRLSHPPPGGFEVPGNATERAALGYLHANCGHCHNQARPEKDGPPCFDPQNEIDFQLAVPSLAAPEATPAARPGRGRCSEPGAPAGSRMTGPVPPRGFGGQMRPLATERVDEDAVRLLRAWIDGMGTGR